MEAWDIAIRIAPQIRQDFPLSDALTLAQSLGYKNHAMGEFLPAIARGVTLALLNKN